MYVYLRLFGTEIGALDMSSEQQGRHAESGGSSSTVTWESIPQVHELEPTPSAPPLLTDIDPHLFPQSANQREIQSFIWDSNKMDMATLLANWMGINVVQKSRIWDITIPGSHNSATYEITHQESKRALMKFVSQFVRCQDMTIYQQLMNGIRFLDLRLCKHPQQPGVPYCAHGGYRTAPLLDVYRQIAKFLDEHPTEIVLISGKKDEGFEKGEGMISLLESDFWLSLYLGRFLGVKLRNDTTVADMVKRGQQVVYFFNTVERYLPSDNDMFIPNFETHKSINFKGMDSVLDAPVIPRHIPCPDEMKVHLETPAPKKSPLQFLGDLSPVVSLVPSMVASPTSGAQTPINGRWLAPRHGSEPPPDTAALAASTVDTEPVLQEPATPEPSPRDKEKTKKDRKKNAMTAAQIIEYETLFITRCLQECLPSLQDVGTQALRRHIGNTICASSEDRSFFELSWRGGIVQYAPPADQIVRINNARAVNMSSPKFDGGDIMAQAREGDQAEIYASDLLPSSPRFRCLPPSQVLKLGHLDAQRFKTVGLKQEFFIHPLKGKVGTNFMFVSPLKCGRTLIEKSWAQTRESNVNFLMPKIKYWTAMHGNKMPRPPYRFRIIAAEVTPPTTASPQAGTEILKFWATQSAFSLLFLPSGLRPHANAANRLLADAISKELVSRLNGITHDFIVPKIVIAILFLEMKILSEQSKVQISAALKAARSPDFPSGSSSSGNGHKQEKVIHKKKRREAEAQIGLADILMKPNIESADVSKTDGDGDLPMRADELAENAVRGKQDVMTANHRLQTTK